MVYADSDVHGRLDLLRRLVDLIRDDWRRNGAAATPVAVFLGDYIDRGPESRGVVDFLVSGPLPDFSTVFLMGNHEAALLDFVDDRSDAGGWLTYGGLETMLSYGVAVRAMPASPEENDELRAAIASAVPGNHLAFFRGCALSHVEGDYVFVHAGVRPGRSIDRQSPEDLLWIRDDFLRSTTPCPGKVVVHGHTICDEPQDLGYRINVDTGAFVSGRLTCVVLRSGSRRFLSTA